MKTKLEVLVILVEEFQFHMMMPILVLVVGLVVVGLVVVHNLEFDMCFVEVECYDILVDLEVVHMFVEVVVHKEKEFEFGILVDLVDIVLVEGVFERQIEHLDYMECWMVDIDLVVEGIVDLVVVEEIQFEVDIDLVVVENVLVVVVDIVLVDLEDIDLVVVVDIRMEFVLGFGMDETLYSRFF
jgi:hypothetical protein